MSSHERRIAPRKSYAIPVRFNVLTEQYAMLGVASVATAPAHANAKILTTIPLPQQGEIVNLVRAGHRIQDPAKSERWRNAWKYFSRCPPH